VTLLIGVEASDMDTVFELIEQACRPPEHPDENKAVIFVIPMEDFVQLG
jgi:uncharacterized protein YaaQ